MPTINYTAINSNLFVSLQNAKDGYERREIESRIIEINNKLVYRAAHRWSNYRNVPLPLDELYSIGLNGLLTALRNFDVTKGVRFSTFATSHINGAIKRTIRDKGSLVKIPQSLQGDGEGQVKVGSIKYLPIDDEEVGIDLSKTYDAYSFNAKVESWLEPFKEERITPTQVREKCIEAMNRLVDMGVIEQDKIKGKSVVIDGVEYRQGTLW